MGEVQQEVGSETREQQLLVYYAMLCQQYDETFDAYERSCLNYQIVSVLVQIGGREKEIYLEAKKYVKNVLSALDSKGFKYDELNTERVERMVVSLSDNCQLKFYSFLFRKLATYHYTEYLDWCGSKKTMLALRIKKKHHPIVSVCEHCIILLCKRCFGHKLGPVFVVVFYVLIATIVLSEEVSSIVPFATLKTQAYVTDPYFNYLLNVVVLHLSLDDNVKLLFHSPIAVIVIAIIKLIFISGFVVAVSLLTSHALSRIITYDKSN